MLKYICISLFLQLSVVALAQQNNTSSINSKKNQDEEEGTPLQKKEKIPYPNKKRGLSLGIDVSRFLVPIFDKERKTAEGFVRMNFKKRMFLVGDLGYEKTSFDDKPYTYNSDGMFMRLGCDYDIFVVDEPNNNDNILIGLRYGFAFQNHGASSVRIGKDYYWGDYETSISSYNLTSHWAELTFGLRTELFKNFYMSWFIRIKSRIIVSNKEILEPYSIPGFGKGDNKMSLGLSYNLEYQIPWGNKK